jgi:AcrR family transcriptional regulator
VEGTQVGAKVDGRQRRGDLTRSAVLQRAVDVASMVGLEGLSIGRLASELSISKSGLFAHFGAKEELQLATIRAAKRIFVQAVIDPAREEHAGLGQLWRLSLAWLDYSRTRVFPGGCFFSKAAYDFGARPGAVRDAIATSNREWMDYLTQLVQEAQQAGDVRPDVDAAQLAFDLNALYDGANTSSLLGDEGDDTMYDRAERSLRDRLAAVASPGVELPWDR